MSQEFNKISTTSNLIKNLLISTYLPLIRTIRDLDYILADRLYVYKCNIIKCTKSGYVATGYQYKSFDGKRAEFRTLGEYHFGEKNDKLCTNYISNSEGYDSITHERLGRYLRNLRDMYDLNLMPLYNCFSNQIFQAHHIICKGDWSKDRVEKTSENFNTKVFKIPIRFNTDYTICIENIGVTTFAPAFIKNNNLIKLNNNKFGNGVDVTNKYSRLYRTDVITSKTGLRFKDPIKIRFNNVPVTRKVADYVKTPFSVDTLHNNTLYKVWTDTLVPRENYYIKNDGYYSIARITEELYNEDPLKYYYNDNGIITQCDISLPYDSNRIYYTYDELIDGDTYLLTDLKPETTNQTLYVGVGPHTGRLDIVIEEGKKYIYYDESTKSLVQNMDKDDKINISVHDYIMKVEAGREKNYDSANFETVCLNRQCSSDYSYNPNETYYTKEAGIFYKWDYVLSEKEYNDNTALYYIKRDNRYIRCDRSGEPYNPEETYYVKYLDDYITAKEYYFIYNTTDFYIGLGFKDSPETYFKINDNKIEECSIDEVFDINTTYLSIKQIKFFTWRVRNPNFDPTVPESIYNPRLINSTDSYIHEGVQYYYSYDLETEEPYIYDITEENCAMYEYLEDNLCLLIQVPKDFEQNILVLEGDYTRTEVKKVVDTSELDLLPQPIIDHLYTSNLQLMQVPTKKIIPFSDTLIEFLLWNAINNLDSLNNNLDRLVLALNNINYNDVTYNNYWYPGMRKLVYEAARDYNQIPITDNLGYVTKDIEDVIFNTTYGRDRYINDYNPEYYTEEEF